MTTIKVGDIVQRIGNPDEIAIVLYVGGRAKDGSGTFAEMQYRGTLHSFRTIAEKWEVVR